MATSPGLPHSPSPGSWPCWDLLPFLGKKYLGTAYEDVPLCMVCNSELSFCKGEKKSEAAPTASFPEANGARNVLVKMRVGPVGKPHAPLSLLPFVL